jgi:hypothetical protein
MEIASHSNSRPHYANLMVSDLQAVHGAASKTTIGILEMAVVLMELSWVNGMRTCSRRDSTNRIVTTPTFLAHQYQQVVNVLLKLLVVGHP